MHINIDVENWILRVLKEIIKIDSQDQKLQQKQCWFAAVLGLILIQGIVIFITYLENYSSQSTLLILKTYYNFLNDNSAEHIKIVVRNADIKGSMLPQVF